MTVQPQQVVQQPQQGQPQITNMDGYYAYLGNQQTQYAQQPQQQGQPIIMQQQPQQQQQAPIYVPVNSNVVQAQPQGANFTAPAATPEVANNQQNVQNLDNFKSEMKTALGGIFDMMTGNNNNNGQQQQPMMQQVPMAPQESGWLDGTSGTAIKITGGFVAGYGAHKILSSNNTAEAAMRVAGNVATEVSKNGGAVAQLAKGFLTNVASKIFKF